MFYTPPPQSAAVRQWPRRPPRPSLTRAACLPGTRREPEAAAPGQPLADHPPTPKPGLALRGQRSLRPLGTGGRASRPGRRLEGCRAAAPVRHPSGPSAWPPAGARASGPRPAGPGTDQAASRPSRRTHGGGRTAAPRAARTLPPLPAARQPHLGRAPRSHRPPAAPPPPPPPAPGPSPPLPQPPLPAPPAPGSASRPRPLGARASGQTRTLASVGMAGLFAAG